MADRLVGSRYPPNIFEDWRDDDWYRALKKVFHACFDPINPLSLEAAAKEIDSYFPTCTKEQYEEIQRKLEAGEEQKHPGSIVWAHPG